MTMFSRREAIRLAAEALGSNRELAKRSGVKEAGIGKIINGRQKTMTEATWDKLLPYVKPYYKDKEDMPPSVGTHADLNVAESPAEYGGPGMSIKTGEGGSIIVNIHAPTVHLHFADGAVDIKKL